MPTASSPPTGSSISGIKAIADYVHSKGLKFGIYSDAGRETCDGFSGSQGHEYQDAMTYARWGVDYLKYDWCETGSRNGEEAYAVMADALRASGRPIVFSMCESGGVQAVAMGPKHRQPLAHNRRHSGQF